MTSSGSHLLEIDERFCQCPICLQQYKEPKQLPCLHRYCSTCLQEILDRNVSVGVITCPECREQFEIPKNGVDGFKTDFNIKNVIEYIQLQKSLEDEQLRECLDCAKETKVTAYCFKCNDFLCKNCHNTHVTKKMLKDHKQHTLTLENIKSRNMTLEKLVALKEAPRCQDHPENLSQLCCRTCNNLPICLTCTYGSHEDHKIKDVHIPATEEKKSLHEQLQILSQYKERMYKMSERVEKIRTDLSSNAKEKEEFYQTRHKRDVDNTEAEIKNMKDSKKMREDELKNKVEKNVTEAREAMEKELEEIKQKYDNICDGIRKEGETELRKLMTENEEHLQKY